jgi:hypothetical protein
MSSCASDPLSFGDAEDFRTLAATLAVARVCRKLRRVGFIEGDYTDFARESRSFRFQD